jgi:hypothetical protein
MDPFTPYLAGFFDGDGSLHFQIVRSKVYRYGFYLRSSLVFYQSTSCEEGLLEIQQRIGGRLRRRGMMSDVTITNRPAIRSLLAAMQPYVVFKRAQVEEGLKLLERLPPPRNPQGFLEVCEAVDRFASLNFSKSRTVTSETVRETFVSKGLLVPVTTDPPGSAQLRIFD